MKVLVTGSAGHLGEGLVRTLKARQYDVIGIDIKTSLFTTRVGSIADREFVESCLDGIQAVIHTATLHKPHVATHSKQEFIDTNITGTLNLLEASVAAGVEAFVFTSTTSVFGDALIPPAGMPAAWITEAVTPVPKNIYGVTKTAAEDLCQLFFRNHGLPCIVLRTSRFFPEEDDNRARRGAYADDNLKINEFLCRRVDLEDVVEAHILAAKRAKEIGFGKYIISATTPFRQAHMQLLRNNAIGVVNELIPAYLTEYQHRDWRMFGEIDRVYVNEKARQELGWQPRYDFSYIIELLKAGKDFRSPLTLDVGAKGYHEEIFEDGPYPI
ncbi:NAD-dependent epimerase/dehydratase family protein [Chitinophaga rhizophila]|uniref:NAD(P)-dependent oxidoreductase n=1 Tax=Chitinophaga rhizophila TaxID=2866212 RepID=A0ABS7GDD4_9BACT|nr:NAD(P)-dependent oxidoreductase [Chitinophaga rhizophila]MBW8685690.1 NAD(P)-dependent oxidoreductase [Chitinophaga rhizophila]